MQKLCIASLCDYGINRIKSNKWFLIYEKQHYFKSRDTGWIGLKLQFLLDDKLNECATDNVIFI